MKCSVCSAETAGRRLCGNCTVYLRVRLQRFAEVWADAPTTVRRQDKVSRSAVRSGGAATPLVMNADVAALLAEVELHLRRWHAVLCHAPTVPRSVGDVIADLYDAAEYIARRSAATQLLQWVGYTSDRIATAVDLPPERQWLGYCDRCGRDLWAEVGERTVQCICRGAEPILVDQRHRTLVYRMKDKLLTAAEAARLLSQYGERVGESTIHSWAKKQLLTSRGEGPNGRLYLVGDVLGLMEQAEDRRRRREEDRARA